jgi:hypothetical protein
MTEVLLQGVKVSHAVLLAMVGALSPKPFEDIRMRGPSVAQSVTPVCDGFAFFKFKCSTPDKSQQ